MATHTTHSHTVGVFHTRAAAERAVADLRAAGYRDDQIGLVGKDDRGKTVKTGGGEGGRCPRHLHPARRV